jgi:hypothetical protein
MAPSHHSLLYLVGTSTNHVTLGKLPSLNIMSYSVKYGYTTQDSEETTLHLACNECLRNGGYY